MKYDNNKLADAVKVSKSWAGVYRLLTGAAEEKSSPGLQTHFKRRAVKAGIDFSHFSFKRKPKVAVAVDPNSPAPQVPPSVEPSVA